MRRFAFARAAAAAVLCPLAVAQAQTSGALSVVPTLSIAQSYTDNTNLSNTDKRAEAVTTLSPGVRMSSRSGRLQGSLDYALNVQAYAREHDRSGFTNELAAAFTAEVVPQTASVDVRANISQQNISAFGARASDPLLAESNRTEARTFSVSPVLRGRLGSNVTTEARSTWTRTTNTSSQSSDSTTIAHSARVSGQAGRIGWSADLTDLTSDFDNGGRETGNRRLGLALSYSPNPDWQFSLRGGRETDTVRSLESQSTTNYGVGAVWSPSPRTTVNGQFDRRYFGNGHSIQLSHRMARGVVTYSDSQDANNGAVSDRTLEFARSYDDLFNKQLVGIPDLALRDFIVRELLRQQGIFIGRAVALQRRQDLSFALQGVRASMAVSAFRSSSRRLDQVSSASDDLSLADGLKQHGYSLTANYTVSPTVGVVMSYSSSTNSGNNASVPGVNNELKTLTATLSGRLARRVSYSLLVRHATFDSTLNPYTENGGQLSLSFQF